jgi:molybdenum cofactor cytidylyltransferase
MMSAVESPISLAEALQIIRGDVVSFVGGGGKTTSMLRLARELSSRGWRVVATTSTHIAEEQIGLFPVHAHPENMEVLSSCLDRYGQCLLVGRPDGRGSVIRLAPDIIIALRSRADVDCILIEADGSKSRPFKAPAAHEPVVPETTTLLVPVAGMDCLGRPLDEKSVHRPEIVARLAGCRLGRIITPETVARTLAHPEGGAKNLPAGARLIPLLNKADTCSIRALRETARGLLQFPNVDAVVAASVDRDPPVRGIWPSGTDGAGC